MKIENPQQYVGKIYGNTTIIEYIGRYRDNTYSFKCKCNCGNEFYIRMRKKDKVRFNCFNCEMYVMRSKNKVKLYNYNGENLTLKELSKKLNINRSTLLSRIYTYKWNSDRWAEPVKRRINGNT